MRLETSGSTGGRSRDRTNARRNAGTASATIRVWNAALTGRAAQSMPARPNAATACSTAPDSPPITVLWRLFTAATST